MRRLYKMYSERRLIAAVLDVSGNHRCYHQHTLALVKMSGKWLKTTGWLTTIAA